MNVPLLHFCRLISLALLVTPSFAAETESIQSVEKSATEWVKIRLETVRLETEWASDQVLLKSTINALKERAQLMEEKRSELKAKTAEERAELDTLLVKQKAAATEAELVEKRLKDLSAQLLALRPTLPPRLSDALEMSFRSLAETELSADERMQFAMTVLNRCAQFNHSINLGSEVLTLDGQASPKSLDVIYWGLSHAYALDPAAGKAWFGSPGAERWQWEPMPEPQRVAELMAIHNDKSDPAFVSVRAQVKKTFATSAP